MDRASRAVGSDVGAAEVSGDCDGLSLAEFGSGGDCLLEALRPQCFAYLSSQLALAWPQHRPGTEPDAIAQAVGSRRQPRRSLRIARRECQPGELDEYQTHVAAVVRG